MTAPPSTAQWLRTAARRISAGTGILAWHLGRRGHKAAGGRARGLRAGVSRWLGESNGLGETVVRWALLAGGAWIAWALGRLVLGLGVHMLAGARWLLWPAAVVYLVAAYRAGGEKAPTTTGVLAAEASPATTPTAPPQTIVPRDRFVQLLHTEIGTGRAVHLAHLAAVLGEVYPGQAWDVPAVAALCAAYGIPVEPKVRAHGKGATRGVQRTALPPLAEEAPAGPLETVDIAGQESSTGLSTSTSTDPSTDGGVGSGKGFVTVPDDRKPHRTHVRWASRKTG